MYTTAIACCLVMNDNYNLTYFKENGYIFFIYLGILKFI